MKQLQFKSTMWNPSANLELADCIFGYLHTEVHVYIRMQHNELYIRMQHNEQCNSQTKNSDRAIKQIIVPNFRGVNISRIHS